MLRVHQHPADDSATIFQRLVQELASWINLDLRFQRSAVDALQESLKPISCHYLVAPTYVLRTQSRAPFNPKICSWLGAFRSECMCFPTQDLIILPSWKDLMTTKKLRNLGILPVHPNHALLAYQVQANAV